MCISEYFNTAKAKIRLQKLGSDYSLSAKGAFFVRKISKSLLTVLITFSLTVLLICSAILMFLHSYDIPFKKLVKIGTIINELYVGEYDEKQLEENAINAVIEVLGDKYAVYYDEENVKETMQLLDGYYVGIGVEVFANTEKNAIEVISAYEDSPAEKAGIKSGDLIVKVDNIGYTAKNIADAILYMKGVGEAELNKELSIELERNGERFVVKLRRKKINMYKVSSKVIDEICYIRYSGFTENSEKELENIINSLDKEKVRGIVLDIRNNPGGNLESAISACDLFLDDGLIMYTTDKKGEKKEFFATKGACNLPLALLVNSSSASASEILAGSLQDRGRAIIVGEKTYGKGVTQTIRYINPFDEKEGAIKLTTYKNFTPSGKWIDESIIPDIEIKSENADKEIQNDAAFIAAVNAISR